MIAQHIDTAASIWVSRQQQVKALEYLREWLHYESDRIADEQLEAISEAVFEVKTSTADCELIALVTDISGYISDIWAARDSRVCEAEHDPYQYADDYEDDLRGRW